MIRYSLRRPVGGRRYSSTDRAAARRLQALDAPATLTPEAVAAATSPDGIHPVVDVLFELESNRFARPTTVQLLANGDPVTPSAGTLPSIVDGYRVTVASRPAVLFPPSIALTDDPVVELTWVGARTVNVVEVHGSASAGQITAATVDYRDAASGAWVEGYASAEGSAGRLAVAFPTAVQASGVRVHVTAFDGSGAIAVVEVDPLWIVDVSDTVVGIDVEVSRETDPGASATPIGSYEASTMTLTLDDTAGFWNPSTNASLDVGHRVEVAMGFRFPAEDGSLIEELVSGGVFYTEPYDTDSTATTVTIVGTDRLGRNASTPLSEPVAVNTTVQTLIRGVAARYLDLDSEQVYVSPSLADLVIPYAWPSGNLGEYLADVAKALGATVHMGAVDQLSLAARTDVGLDVVAEIAPDTSLISFRRPPGYDVTASAVTVTAAPLTPAALGDLWAMPSGGLVIASGQSYNLIAVYDSPPAINAVVSGVVADGAYTITASSFYADRAELTIRNDAGRTLVVADLRVRGNPLVESSMSARREHAPSITRYGPRTLEIDARLVQTQTQLDTLATVLLDAFRSLDDNGVRRLPDVEFDALGMVHLATGDRITLSDPEKGLSGDYTVLSRRLSYDGVRLTLSGRVREAPSAPFLVADVNLSDDVYVAGY